MSNHFNESGHDKEAKDICEYTTFIIALIQCHVEVVNYRVSVGIDKDVKNKNGKTALDVANNNVNV
ncbi:hypothetical protein TVAG_489850 [Trichomonas vaginalis G3]|uniref:Uncharacterized protein n=1 Tax=Trichomonas vaginalis (strain ATCC PRA-98 / G3) TaxID=412133 RepID=A2FQ74_TRIV3|nr:Ankyrin repeat family [Trichomonas vaginalis G3]EAX92946.1 hypothetical protein TVAG_489850 [Trichomonas vaginalis G3]KAI5553164.1 Ankyrin repeat family [Trichomonas vaginalis G3]|eukprot:XP_001305876.1 hypothetical protein [Trichomonas vaginalis G3]